MIKRLNRSFLLLRPDPSPVYEYEECKKEFPAPVVYPLAHTQWKLVGVVYETDEVKEITTLAHPEDCEDCYTLNFDTDSTASVHSIVIDLTLNLSRLNPCVSIQDILFCELNYCDSDTFRNAIHLAGSYAASADELKIYYSYYYPKMNYLLFKRIKS
jgi:hypothetical protein